MNHTRPLVLASSNAGKLRELEVLLAPLGWQLSPQAAFGVEPAEENGADFASNALLKAYHAARVTGLPALADDSGLEVAALGGAPGIHSARYAGECADDAANNRKLLEALEGLPPAQRDACFRCVIALVCNADDPQPLLAQGRWDGRILTTPKGAGGFGYDPLFAPDGGANSSAELSFADKQQLSHRGQALRSLLTQLHAGWPQNNDSSPI